jgi:maltooligosyltrehalose trehalohydrolase
MNQDAFPWKLRRGANVLGMPGTKRVQFSVWAPQASRVYVEVLGEGACEVAMSPGNFGVFSVTIEGIGAGTDYYLRVDDHARCPDPVSRWQPQGVHGPSRVVDPREFAWQDHAWQGIPRCAYVLYEMHVGTFTPQGTFDAAIEKVPHLVDLGVNALEIMPVAHFPGTRNWGYDGVDLYAPHSAYGGPEGLRRLVQACHLHGLAVVLDVVYNHLGPDGNYLARFGPYFTDRYATPWGAAINFDGEGSEGVRRFFVDNARYWLDEFHIDALRLDAIHGIFDASDPHVLSEIVHAVEEQSASTACQAYAIAESDLNDVNLITSRDENGIGMHAQWSDDFHHALHTTLTRTSRGYFADFGRMEDLARAFTEGFVYSGQFSKHRNSVHGTNSTHVPGEFFLVFNQNHDQIANGSGGDRLSMLVSFELQKVANAVLMCAPNLPLLFMGQEWGAMTHFHYFTDHSDPALAEAVRVGRAREFMAFDWAQKITDPQAESTFIASKLQWHELEILRHQQMLTCTRDLIHLRRNHSALGAKYKDQIEVKFDESGQWLHVVRRTPQASTLHCIFNFGDQPAPMPKLGANSQAKLLFCTAYSHYGGPGFDERIDQMLPPASAALIEVFPQSSRNFSA